MALVARKLTIPDNVLLPPNMVAIRRVRREDLRLTPSEATPHALEVIVWDHEPDPEGSLRFVEPAVNFVELGVPDRELEPELSLPQLPLQSDRGVGFSRMRAEMAMGSTMSPGRDFVLPAPTPNMLPVPRPGTNWRKYSGMRVVQARALIADPSLGRRLPSQQYAMNGAPRAAAARAGGWATSGYGARGGGAAAPAGPA